MRPTIYTSSLIVTELYYLTKWAEADHGCGGRPIARLPRADQAVSHESGGPPGLGQPGDQALPGRPGGPGRAEPGRPARRGGRRDGPVGQRQVHAAEPDRRAGQ